MKYYIKKGTALTLLRSRGWLLLNSNISFEIDEFEIGNIDETRQSLKIGMS